MNDLSDFNNYLDSLLDKHDFNTALAFIDHCDPDNRYFSDIRADIQRLADEDNAIRSKLGNDIKAYNDLMDSEALTNLNVLHAKYTNHLNDNPEYEFSETNPDAAEAYKYLNAKGNSKVIFKLQNVRRGFMGIDWMAKDVNNEELLLNMLNMDKATLIANGINIKTINGECIVEINDTKKAGNLYGTIFKTIGEIDSSLIQDVNLSRIYDKDGNEIYIKNKVSAESTAEEYYNLIEKNKAKQDKNKLELADSLYGEENILEGTTWNLPIDNSKESHDLFVQHVKSIGNFRNVDWYYGVNNEALELFGGSDENSKEYEQFLREFNAANPARIHFAGACFNNTTGLLITLDPRHNEEGKPYNDVKKIFIPNFMPELINYDKNDTKLRASNIVNKMNSFKSHYKHTFSDGSKGYLDENGLYHKIDKNGNETINLSDDPKYSLRDDINKDIIINDAKQYVKQHYVNRNGEINKSLAEEFAKTIAIGIGEEIMGNTPLLDIYDKAIDIKSIFDNKEKIVERLNEDYTDIVAKKIELILNSYYDIINNVYLNYTPIN